ncbi:LrgB family protein [Falsigemmobacter intermedius]|uniref:LrgB family protein n=1 Tax=Falsigemmobacter intermedius TaxID=1553448 RepID=A0A444MBG0_9RHOB|nr:LrgB family protein [Falsigemmobacter intermedius]RWY41067.1 LrgB family protein [Falsigemmobacter intermedius]
MTDFAEIWGYLGRDPLLWLTLTLGAYVLGDAASRASGRNPLVNPVLIAMVILGTTLWATSTPYPVYFEGAQFVHFMLGPATVSLAVPLYGQVHRIRKAALPLIGALLAGIVTSVLTVVWIGEAMGLERQVLLSLVPKSATAPVALGVSESLGGSPTLTAVLVILTGICGAVVVTPLMNAIGIRDWRARGFSVGVAAHGIGAARALQVNDTAGAFAAAGMGLSAIATAFLAPILAGWLL